MRDINYAEWAEYLKEIFDEYVDDSARVLELAAGNGSLARCLQKYYKPIIITTDISLDMLKDCQYDLQLLCCDMTKLPFKNKFDTIFSAFDSVNYLTSEEQIKSLFIEVKRVLSEEGVFTFDVSLEKNSLKNEKYLNRRGKFEDYYFIQRSNYNRQERIHYNKFELTLNTGQTIEELHAQKIYPVELFYDIAKDTGFYVMEALDAFSFEDVNKKSERAQFVLKIDKE